MDINVDDYKILNLNKDPFSTAPDPEFLYQSRQHFGTLQLLECSIKNEKGINVVLGPSGTGKTTICRQLYRKVSFEKNVLPQILSARYYDNSDQLIREIAENFDFVDFNKSDDIFEVFVNNYNRNGKSIALIIDNGHMIPEFCLSVLNRLNDLRSGGVNFFKIVIFANNEFSANIEANPDFQTRIINYRILGSFNFRDTRQMIFHLLKMAGGNISSTRSSKARKLFSYPAMFAIYLATGGSPRKIVILCHRCIVVMLLTKTIRAGWFLVRSNAKRVLESRKIIPESAIASALIIGPLVAVALAIGVVNDHDFTNYLKAVNHIVSKVSIDNKIVPKAKEPVVDNLEVIDEGDGMIFPDIYFTDETEINDQQVKVNTIEVKTVAVEVNETQNQISEPVPKKTVITESQEKDLKSLVPEIIGSVEVKRGDSLLVMLESVYGHSRLKYKIPVVEANKHLLNIHSLEIGDKIHFPTIIAIPSKKGVDNVWIKIKSTENLNEAVNFKRSWMYRDLRIKIIPYYFSGSGMKFDIVFKNFYSTKEDAEKFINNLPIEVKEEPEIIEFQLNKSVFFADPYAM